MMHALTLGTSALLNGSSSRALLSLDFTTAAISSVTSYPGWTFSGGTTTNSANRYAEDNAGQLVAFASGQPRITDRGLLVEEARTNLVLQSNDLSSAAWTKANTTAALVAGAPDGGLASRLSATAAFATAFQGLVSVSANTTYAVSAYVKNVNTSDASIVLEAADHGGNSAVISYNFTNKTIGGSNTGFSIVSRTALEIGGGWTRLTIVLTTPAGLTTLRPKPWVGLYSGTNYSGQAIDWWCIQIEPGSFPTSPIVTTTAAATRAADNASVTGLGGILTPPVTLVAWAVQDVIFASSRSAVSANDGSNSNRLTLYRQGPGGIGAFVNPGTTAIIGPSAIAGTVQKSAARYRPSVVAFAAQGSLVSAGTAVSSPSALSTLTIGNAFSGGGEWFNGYIQRVAIYGDVDDNRLISLTT